jgi:chromosomal replication initiation ATPase DnaA
MDETLSLAGYTLSSRFRGIANKAVQDDSTASNIRVLVRVRPLNQSEISGNQGENGHINVVHMDEKKDQPSSELTVRFGSAKKRYAFDAIHGPNSTQREVFQSVKDIIDAVADGYNGTIMAYGQTSSGKTHTVFGHSEG